MKFQELFSLAQVSPKQLEGDASLSGMAADSRQANSGSLFVCMPGANLDSHDYIPQAASQGASAVIAHGQDGYDGARQLGLAAALLEPEQFRDSLWRLCKVFFGDPSASMKVVGVTGTNGKTTTAWLLRDMLAQYGASAYLGTLGFQYPGEERELANTTPFPIDLYAMFAEARDAGVGALAMEVSSHSLEEKRADGIEFDAAVFTNLTQDHLDYHGDMIAYGKAKRRLFEEFPGQTAKRFVAAYNVDDPMGLLWSKQIAGEKITYGLGGGELRGTAREIQVERLRLHLAFRGDEVEIEVPLGGHFNVENSLSAAAGFLALGYSLSDVAQVLPKVRRVPGRFEAVPNAREIGVLVDYAHTPDALIKLLDSVRALRPARIITVFGCGGDRDRTKRPKMARAVSERSDVSVLTSDNPRTEDPASILAEVEAGILPGRNSASIIDRREAIAHAISIAQPRDVVVIAGKGHENYQIIGRTKYPMDDREMAREALK